MSELDQDLSDKVHTQLLKAARPALRRLARACRGRADFHSEMELRACLGLARVAATLLRRPSEPSLTADDKVFRRLLASSARKNKGGI